MICGTVVEFKLGGNSKLPPNYAPTSHLLSPGYKIGRCWLKTSRKAGQAVGYQ